MIKTVKEAAEVAANYMYDYYDNVICGEQKEGIEFACDIYKTITGEDMDVEAVLGIDPNDMEDIYDDYEEKFGL